MNNIIKDTIKSLIKKTLLCFIILPVVFNYTLAQNSYFQQEVNFEIEAKLNDKNNTISAFETIEYTNNSPDTLYFIFFHLWANAYKNNKTALALQQIQIGNKDFYFSDDTEKGYIDSLDFKINGKQAKWEIDKQYIDICKLHLNKPLVPGEKIIITTPFYIKIPDSDFSRLGHYKESYQITQWYPKPAVYDDEGWHQFPYLDMGEFYSEFGSYKVSITLPENYTVCATGNLMDNEEIKRLDKLAEQTKNKKSFNEYDISFPASSDKLKTLHYQEDKIHDFAWFADKRFNVLKGEIILPHSKKRVNTWIFFTNYEGELWKNAIEYVNDAVYYYSKWYGDYPYNNCTAVEGALSAGGGMEYPTITIIGSAGNALSLEEVIMHEVGHNWFYGILGSNERDHPWMDEGINSFSELRYMNTKYPGLKMYSRFMSGSLAHKLNIYNIPYKSQFEIPYIFNARRGLDQAANLKSTKYLAMNYGVVAYMKTAFIFNQLMHYLGEKEFDRIMKVYYEKWKFKHPKPKDIKQIFYDNSTKDLSWFFDDLLTTTKKIDYKICKIKKITGSKNPETKNYEIIVKNTGEIKAPFTISTLNKEKEIINTQQIEGFCNKKRIAINDRYFNYIRIDADNNIPDIYKKNNTIRRKGLFKKTETINIHLIGTLENADKTYLFYTPVAGYNNYNGIMAGVLLYNGIIPMKKFEYRIMPMYGFHNGRLAGNITMEHHFLPGKNFRRIDFSVSASQYSAYKNTDFHKIDSKIDFIIKAPLYKYKESHIILKSTYANDIQALIEDSVSYKVFSDIAFTHSRITKINPYIFGIYAEGGKGYAKAWLSGKYKFTYENYKKSFSIRFFAGKFLYNAKEYYGNYNFRLSGPTGLQDYKFEHIYLGRTETPASTGYGKLLFNQFTMSDGGFAIYSPLGQTNNWLTALNMKIDIPIPPPLSIYCNVGFYDGMYKINPKIFMVSETGLCLNIIKDIFEIYFPLTMTKDIERANNIYTDNYLEKIRFILNLNLLNPVKFAHNFKM